MNTSHSVKHTVGLIMRRTPGGTGSILLAEERMDSIKYQQTQEANMTMGENS